MKIISLNTWNEFHEGLTSYLQLTVERRQQYIFRGEANCDWKLQATLDRKRDFASAEQRQTCINRLIREFRHESSGLISKGLPRTAYGLELLGRHHGLQTPILDWTRSPYYAAFFAFDDDAVTTADFASIWMLDREAFQNCEIPQIKIIDDDDEIVFNRRAVEQRGIFIRVADSGQALEEIVGDALTRYDIKSTERSAALADLDEMGINARTLFRSLDGAARTANQRILLLNEES